VLAASLTALARLDSRLAGWLALAGVGGDPARSLC
jgi:hypothetical protein